MVQRRKKLTDTNLKTNTRSALALVSSTPRTNRTHSV